MGILVGLVLQIALLFLQIFLAAVFFLIRRMDITNGILVSGLIQILSSNMEIKSGIRWVVFFAALAIFVLLQHRFRLGRILFSLFSCVAFAFLASIWTTHDSVWLTYGIPAVVFLIILFLNTASWVMMGKDPAYS